MTQDLDHYWTPRATLALLVTAGMLALSAAPNSTNAQEKPKSEAKDQKKSEPTPQPKDQKKSESTPQPKDQQKAESKPQAKDEKKAESKPQVKAEKKAESKPAQAPPTPPAADPAKLKEQVAALEKDVAALKLKVATLELEKLGALVTIDKTKDGKETATVNILKKWSGDKDALLLLKNVPNLQVVYIDNGQVNDAAVVPLKELTGLSALTLMSPQVTDAGLESQGADQPDDAFLDQLQGRRQGPAEPQGAQESAGPGLEPDPGDRRGPRCAQGSQESQVGLPDRHQGDRGGRREAQADAPRCGCIQIDVIMQIKSREPSRETERALVRSDSVQRPCWFTTPAGEPPGRVCDGGRVGFRPARPA